MARAFWSINCAWRFWKAWLRLSSISVSVRLSKIFGRPTDIPFVGSGFLSDSVLASSREAAVETDLWGAVGEFAVIDGVETPSAAVDPAVVVGGGSGVGCPSARSGTPKMARPRARRIRDGVGIACPKSFGNTGV